ncbi:hypothetical protein [Aequorivita antarctica]|uniref:Uncharacterized protein n=1 Tax=Aequorivita antarctica TaxID=153266 RepID=A0A5C6YUH8_9FLAO|nr:hypothetical protein [Aequorivita antarctica]TXD71218.1 hypothetical protein ESU54_17585 [Aequorivita antarctica]
MHFNIDFDLNISTHYCYDKSEKISTSDFEIDFFLMTNKAHIKEIELTKNNSEHYNLNGTYEFIYTSLSFRPTLVVMVKPKYNIVSNCGNIIKTYLIDFEKVDHITKSIGKPGYTLSINLGSIKLSDKHFIRIKNTGEKILKEYEYFQSKQPNLPFRYSIDMWYKLNLECKK